MKMLDMLDTLDRKLTSQPDSQPAFGAGLHPGLQLSRRQEDLGARLPPNRRGLGNFFLETSEKVIGIIRPLRDFRLGAEVFRQSDEMFPGGINQVRAAIWKRSVILGRSSKRARINVPIELGSIELVVRYGDTHWLARCVRPWIEAGLTEPVGTVLLPRTPGRHLWRVSDLHGVPADPRTPAKLDRIAKALRHPTSVAPIEIFVAREGMIGLYDGNHRLAAARMASVPRILTDWTLPE